MLQGEHSAILSTFIKLPFVIKIFVLSTFECPGCFVDNLDENDMVASLAKNIIKDNTKKDDL